MKKFLPLFLMFLISCIQENSPPICEIVSPEEGSEYTRGESIQIYVNASDEDGDIDEVRLYLDELGISSLSSFPYSLTYSTEELEAGFHSITVEAIDNYGKQSDATVSFILKSILPVVETAQPGSITRDAAVVGGTILNDGGGTITEAGILWGIEPYDETDFNEQSVDIIDGSFTITLNDLEYETYYVIAFAENEIGRSYGEKINFTTFLPENSPPLCEIKIPAEGLEFTRGDNIEVKANVSDEDGDIEEVRLFVDSIGVASNSSFPYNFLFSTEGMNVGSHSIRVEAIDNLGDQSDDTVSFVLTPGLPLVETAQPRSITTESAVVGGTIVDNRGGTITAAGILWGLEPYDGTSSNGQSVDIIDDSFTITLNDLEVGTYYVIAFAENEIGRSYGEQVVFSTILP